MHRTLLIDLDMKYIDAELLTSKLTDIATEFITGNYYLDNSEQAIGYEAALTDFEQIIDSLQEESLEISLKKFTEKMEDWKARYNHPDNISIKATMAFTARMFYMYPDVARQWYDSLPKVTLD